MLASGAPKRAAAGPHNCGYGELPRRQRPSPEGPGGRAGVLPFQAGTFCLSARGLSPSTFETIGGGPKDGDAVGVLKWPFALRPYLGVWVLRAPA